MAMTADSRKNPSYPGPSYFYLLRFSNRLEVGLTGILMAWLLALSSVVIYQLVGDFDRKRSWYRRNGIRGISVGAVKMLLCGESPNDAPPVQLKAQPPAKKSRKFPGP